MKWTVEKQQEVRGEKLSPKLPRLLLGVFSFNRQSSKYNRSLRITAVGSLNIPQYFKLNTKLIVIM